jgi:hypothetical protein
MTTANAAARTFASRSTRWRCCVCLKTKSEETMRLVLAPSVGLRKEADWCCEKPCLVKVKDAVDYCVKCWYDDRRQHRAERPCPPKKPEASERRERAASQVELAISHLDDAKDSAILGKLRDVLDDLSDDPEPTEDAEEAKPIEDPGPRCTCRSDLRPDPKCPVGAVVGRHRIGVTLAEAEAPGHQPSCSEVF